MHERHETHLPLAREFCADFADGTTFHGLGICSVHKVPVVIYAEDEEAPKKSRVHFEIVLHEKERGWSRPPEDTPPGWSLVGQLDWQTEGLHPRLQKTWEKMQRSLSLYVTEVGPIPEGEEEPDDFATFVKQVLGDKADVIEIPGLGFVLRLDLGPEEGDA